MPAVTVDDILSLPKIAAPEGAERPGAVPHRRAQRLRR